MCTTFNNSGLYLTTLADALGLQQHASLLPQSSTITAIAYNNATSQYHIYTDDALLTTYNETNGSLIKIQKDMSNVLPGGRPVEAAAFISAAPTPFMLELSGYSLYKDGVYRGEINKPRSCQPEPPQWLIAEK